MADSPNVQVALPPDAQQLSRSRVRIYTASLLIDASTVGFSIALSCHAKEALGAGYWELGFLGALTAFFYSITCYLTRDLSDRMGSRPLMFTSVGLMSAIFLVTMLATTYNHLLLAGACMGISLAFFWPPIQRKLSLLSPGRTLWVTLGRFNVLWAIGVAVGILGTPIVYASWGLAPVLILGLAITVAAVLILVGRMLLPPSENGIQIQFGEKTSPARARFFLHQAWIANFTAFFALVGMVRLFPKISGVMGIDIGKMGWLLAPLDLGKITAFVLLSRFAFWHYSFRWLAGSQAAAGVALVVAGLVEEWVLFVLLFPVVGALSGLTYYSSIYYGLNLREGEGKKSGIHEAVLSSGVCLGPLLCGLVGERFPAYPGAALIFSGVVIFLGLGAQVWNYHRRGRSPNLEDLPRESLDLAGSSRK